MSSQITILGAGESGMGAALLAVDKGIDVFLSDSNIISDEKKNILVKAGIEFEDGKHSKERILSSDKIIKSPGISPTIEILVEARTRNISIIDELEFAAKFTDAKKILITGTNGKTTTTSLIEHLLVNAGIDAKAVGNIGNSFSSELLKADRDVFVIECSSFQLDGLFDFQADIGVLLNITPDHLNRYGDMAGYIKSKMHIADLITKDGVFIYNEDDDNILESKLKVNSAGISLTKKSHAFLDNQRMRFDLNNMKMVIDSNDISLRGNHNKFNAMAATLALTHLNISEKYIREGLKTFQNVAHRLEFIDTINSVDFVNDSKATNVDAVFYALDTFKNQLVWIAGGVDKGNDYEQIQDLVSEKVHSLVCLGTDNDKLKNAFSDHVDHLTETNTMKKAVKQAMQYANANDTVLLSPACASFDLFQNYQDRGDKFKEAVKALQMEIGKEVYNA